MADVTSMAYRTSAMRYLKKMTNSSLEVEMKSSLRDLTAAPEDKVEAHVSNRRITHRRAIQAGWWWRAAARWQPSTRTHPKARCTPLAHMGSKKRTRRPQAKMTPWSTPQASAKAIVKKHFTHALPQKARIKARCSLKWHP